MTGHLLGAAGAIEGIASIMAIRDGIIPPTINTEELDDNILELEQVAYLLLFFLCHIFHFFCHQRIGHKPTLKFQKKSQIIRM